MIILDVIDSAVAVLAVAAAMARFFNLINGRQSSLVLALANTWLAGVNLMLNDWAATYAATVAAAFSWYLWWNNGGGDDTKRRLREFGKKFSPTRRTAPVTS